MTRAAGEAERIQIVGDLTLANAIDWVARLQHAMHRVNVLTVDLSGITCIDAAGIQVLAVARREATARGRSLIFDAHSPAVLEAFRLLGVDPQLQGAVFARVRRDAG